MKPTYDHFAVLVDVPGVWTSLVHTKNNLYCNHQRPSGVCVRIVYWALY